MATAKRGGAKKSAAKGGAKKAAAKKGVKAIQKSKWSWPTSSSGARRNDDDCEES